MIDIDFRVGARVVVVRHRLADGEPHYQSMVGRRGTVASVKPTSAHRPWEVGIRIDGLPWAGVYTFGGDELRPLDLVEAIGELA